jgi:hypothetical protein
MGFLPVSISLSPTAVRSVEPATDATVVIASQLTDSDVTSLLEVRAPDGWACEPTSRPVHLPPGGHTTFPLRVTRPDDAAPGLYYVRVQLPAPGGDLIEDVLTIAVPGGAQDEVLPPAGRGPEIAHELQMHGTVADEARPTGLAITTLTDSVELAPGGTAAVDFRLANHAAGAVDGELMVVSPWGSWSLVDAPVRGFSVAAEATSDLRVDLRAPVGAAPGTTWLMAKFMWFGRVYYSPAVAVQVKPA